MLRPYFAGNTSVLYVPAQNAPSNQVFRLMKIEFNNNGAADRWLMVFPSRTVPINGSQPLTTSIFAQSNFSGIQTLIPEGQSTLAPGFLVLASSTRTTLTYDAGATLDITAYVEEFEILQDSTLAVGDYTSVVDTLQVWTDANGPKKLIKLELTNAAAVTLYAAVYAVDAPGPTSKIQALIPIPAKVGGVNGFTIASFGNVAGLSPFQQDADHTLHDGCTIWVSSITAPGTKYAPPSATIRATYK